MEKFKSPYTGNAAALREHNRLIRKGKAIAARIEADRMISVTIRARTSIEKGSPWDSPAQAPFYGTSINIDKAIPFLEGLIADIKAEEK